MLRTLRRTSVETFLVVFTGIALAALAPAETTWHVDDDAPGDPAPGDPSISDPLEDGSADHPFDAIQEGIDAAVEGETVLVADGIYTGLGNRDLDFRGKAITVRSEGDAYDCRINCEGEGIGVSFRSGETADAVLDGAMIVNAHVEGSHSGAVVCNGSSPTIRNCRIGGSDGPGLACENAAPIIEECWMQGNAGCGVSCDNAAPSLRNCQIRGNLTDGVRCYNSHSVLTSCSVSENTDNGVYCDRGSISITSSHFYENGRFGIQCGYAKSVITSSSAYRNGFGGIYCQRGDSIIDDCTLVENMYVGGAGGGVIIESGDATISRCTISRNFGDVWGGIFFQHGNLNIVDCAITRNIAVHPVALSAGICIDGADAQVSNCTVAMNLGGACGGGIAVVYGARATICNSVLARNDSLAWGGAIYCEYDGDVTLANCTVVENSSGDEGAALFCSGSDATLVNCIVRDNSAPMGPPIVIDGHDPWQPLLTVSHSNIEDAEQAVFLAHDATLDWGPGNIDVDPLFVDPGESDYRLTPGSPCIDAGCNCGVPADTTDLDGDGDFAEFVPFDLDGDGRFFDDPDTPDTGSGWPPVVDMGAYEFGDTDPQPCRGDLDGDRDVDLSDLAALLPDFGTTSGATYVDGDFDCDGDVDLSDLSALLAVYGTSCE